MTFSLKPVRQICFCFWMIATLATVGAWNAQVASVHGQTTVVVHNNLELANVLASWLVVAPTPPVTIIGRGGFSLDTASKTALETYFATDAATFLLQSGAVGVEPAITLTLTELDFHATGGTVALGTLSGGGVNVTLNTFTLNSAAQLRIAGQGMAGTAPNHTITTTGAITIGSPDSFFFEGVSVGRASTLTLAATGGVVGTVIKNNGLMQITQAGNVLTAAPVASVDLGALAAAQGYTGNQLQYFQQLENARDAIIAGGHWTDPVIGTLDAIFHNGLSAGRSWSNPAISANSLNALTVTNNVGAIVLWRQAAAGDDPQSLVASALVRGQSPCGPCGRSGAARSYDIWFQGFTANMDIRSGIPGATGYSVSRNGGVLGINTALGKRTAGGLVLGLSNPYFWDKLEKVDLVDFQLGAHIESQLGNNWEAGAYIGFGMQNGDVTRRHLFNTGFYSYNGDYNGNTLSATVMLSKVYKLGKRSALRPTVAIDTEHAWHFAFTETSNDARQTLDPNASLRQFGRNYYGRTMARVGVMAQTGGQKWGLNGRVFYSPQLGGEDYATATVRLADGANVGSVYEMNALPLGRDMTTLGVGGHRFLNKKGTLLAYGDYSANLFKHATTQVVSLGLQKTF